MNPSPQSPVAVFDSGLGGLTVLKTLIHQFPNENFIYLGDTARLPYGSKSPETIRKYLKQNIMALETYLPKAIIVACNSASTAVDLNLKRKFAQVNQPLFEVISPGAQAAVNLTKSKRIGVLATRSTVESGAYKTALIKLEKDVQVFQQACPLFVPLVEEGWIDDPLTNLVAHRYIAPFKELQLDTVILGCTHYPALTNSIQKILGKEVLLVDSSRVIADQLHENGICKKGSHKTEKGGLTLLSSDYHKSYLNFAEKLLGFLPQNDFLRVDI